ncbi:hypothetical protein [uncultured Methanoregula sp.]|uniref:hypothetical protein n=1 Tax=uncultured Methanoregula sp. TaxID=1005933 RepID=UPI002AAA681C|nr:hypothetical protein [uncultured Methanoregula sp.]
MTVYQGFLYIKLFAIGSKSEQPGYFLQSYPERKTDYTLKAVRATFYGEDKRLHPLNGQKVRIEGTESAEGIEVKSIEKISIFS